MLKEWKCVLVSNHDKVGKTIEEWEKEGWRLHTHSCTQRSIGAEANHYLLFAIDKSKKVPASVKATANAAAAG